jgi:hypothetical protein
MAEYEKLIDCLKLARIAPGALYLFSGSGFSEELKTRASEDAMINLIDLEEL